MLARALAAAALALLISGDPARLGWDAVGLWHFVFPYVWLFVLLESFRARRRIEDGEIFIAGAAMALLYAGVYAKDLQHGSHPFGVDWLGIPCAAFDGGMTAVLAAHAVARLRPRSDDEPSEPRLRAIIFLIFGFAAAASVYAAKTALDFYRGERLLGSTWLVADIAFAAAAWKLARDARERSEERDSPDRETWIWAAAAFAVWLPSARVVARFCSAMDLPPVLLYFFVLAWTAGVVFIARQLWRERGHAATAPAASRPAIIAAFWRIAGALILAIAMGADLNDARAAGLFSILVDWPSRVLFAWAFLTSRLKV